MILTPAKNKVMSAALINDPSLFTDTFKQLDIEINPGKIKSTIIVIVILATSLPILFRFLKMRGKSYEITQNNMILTESGLSTSKFIIPYQNIVRITQESPGIFEGIFGLSTIVLELSALEKNVAHLESMENAVQLMQQLQEQVNVMKLSQNQPS